MRHVSTQLVLFCLLIVTLVGLSCSRENLLTLPAPAPAIAGTYVNLPDNLPLPIPSDSVTVILTSVASDTVDVTVQAIQQGRPVFTMQYPKLPIVQHIEGAVQGTNCINYLIRLKPGSDSSVFYMTCRDVNVLQYARSLGKPYYTGQAARFRKL